jgi:hypothetical protein
LAAGYLPCAFVPATGAPATLCDPKAKTLSPEQTRYPAISIAIRTRKKGAEPMPDSLFGRQSHPLWGRQAADIVVQSAPPGTVAKHVQEQLDETLAVSEISLTESDRAYTLMKGFVDKPGRDPEFQNWFTGKAAQVMADYERAHVEIVRNALRAIIANYPKEIITTIYKDRSFLKGLTDG